jgi:hypothetical protein
LYRVAGTAPNPATFRFLNQGRAEAGVAGESVHAKFVDDLRGGRETEVIFNIFT